MTPGMTVFTQAFTHIIGAEGGFTDNPQDPGNWTGGGVGRGVLRGTNWGISAAAFPALDIKSLTEDAAQQIYRAHYWARIAGDQLPPPLALLAFDAAVNNGSERAIRWLQQALNLAADGRIGPATLAAIAAQQGSGVALCAEYLALRLDFMARLPTWPSFGLGWSRRLCTLAFTSMEMTDE